MTNPSIDPLADHIVVEPLKEDDRKGFLYLPPTTVGKPRRGTVVAVGRGKFVDGKRVPMEVRVGDAIVYEPHAGAEWRLAKQVLVVLSASDVLAVLT